MMAHLRVPVASYLCGLICFLCTGYAKCGDKLFVADSSTHAIYVAETNGTSFVNASFRPLNLSNLVTPVGIDYDYRNDVIYWTDQDRHTVNRAALDGSFQEIIASRSFGLQQGIVLDLEAEKVYWTDAGYDVIEVAKLDGTERREIISTNLQVPRGITYSIKRRKIFWTDRGTLSPKIEMSDRDGSGRTVIVNENIVRPNGIALDFQEQRLFWTDTSRDVIESIDLDSGAHRLRHAGAATPTSSLHLFGISLYFEDIYFSEGNGNKLYVLDLPEDEFIELGVDLENPLELHIYADRTCPPSNLCTADVSSMCRLIDRFQNYECICLPGLIGIHCTEDDPCLPSPCMHGSCRLAGSEYMCDCMPGYTGIKCDSEITCRFLNLPPSTHIAKPKSTYQPGDTINIHCDDESMSVFWTCSASTGIWIQESIACKPVPGTNLLSKILGPISGIIIFGIFSCICCSGRGHYQGGGSGGKLGGDGCG